jgi:HD-GYP domain-containing protein (c-di-GMP phosphodiesterase class II)
VLVHPLAGGSLLRAWGLGGPARFVEEHHERVDGTGYPHGLTGDELALESRVLQAADAFAAMTEDRPYRSALPRAEAIAELERGSGTQFDPAVVDALLDVLAAPVAQPA